MGEGGRGGFRGRREEGGVEDEEKKGKKINQRRVFRAATPAWLLYIVRPGSRGVIATGEVLWY